MAYVYALVDPRDDSWFYVGKGTGKRKDTHFQPWSLRRNRNPHKTNKIKSIRDDGFKPYSEVVLGGLTEELAYLIEEELIDKHGTDLTNIASGGVGGMKGVEKWPDGMPEAVRNKISEANTGRSLSETHKRNLSLSQRGDNGYSKLTEKEAGEVKYLAQKGYHQLDVAREYSIIRQTVSDIKMEKRWSYLEPSEPDSIPDSLDRGNLSSERAAEVKYLAQEGFNQYDIAREYGISQTAVCEYKNGHKRADLQPKEPEVIPSGLDGGLNTLGKKEVGEIKYLLQEEDIHQTEIAEIYDTSTSNVSMIKTGKTWPDVEPKQLR